MTDEELRASYLRASQRKPIRLEVAGLDHPVFLRKFSGKDGSVFAKTMAPYKPGEDDLYSGRLMAALLVSENGVRLYDPANDEHASMLADWDQDLQMAVANEHKKLNHPDKEPEKT